MFSEFSRMARQLGHRGWRLEEENRTFYLSKFHERYNEEEFRFYIKNINNKLHIVNKTHIKSPEETVGIKENNKYYKTAKTLMTSFETIHQRLLVNIS